MHLISINIGAAEKMTEAKVNGLTGIYKKPVDRPVIVGAEGVFGDAVCDRKNHGGPDQAVYVYGELDYAWWSAELGRPLAPGTFGENLTISALASEMCSVGDRLQMGEVVLEVTAARIPCNVLSRRMEDLQFAKRFREAGRPGMYCRVIEPGTVATGMVVRHTLFADPTVSVVEMLRDFYDQNLSEATLRRYLAAPIAIRDRVDNEQKLAKCLAGV
jgi:MOSC domain-containing protein YiiM